MTSLLERLSTSIVRDQTAGVVVQDSTGLILDFNEAATHLLAMSADVLSGRSSADPEWESVDADEQPLAGDDHPTMRALRTGESIVGAVIGVRVGSGAFRWLTVDARLHELDGEHFAVAQFTDITAQRVAERRTAEALSRLQQHALPVIRPGVDWISVESRYENVTAPLDIGGDFVDFFPVDQERCGFFIGDVSGHDLDAVATMVLARHTLRAAGLHLQRPGRILAWLHDTLVSTKDTVFCTAIYGDVTPLTDGRLQVRYANGGHPRGIKIGVDGRCEVIQTTGALIGVITPYTPPTNVEVMLDPGEQLLFYTDGLIESRRERIGEDELVAHIETRRPSSLDETMSFVDDLLATAREQNAPARDDTAVLAMSNPRATD